MALSAYPQLLVTRPRSRDVRTRDPRTRRFSLGLAPVAAHTKVSVRLAQPGDEDEVVRFEDAFDHAPSLAETRRFLSDERHLLLLGYLGDKRVGFVSGVEVFHPDKRPELFLNEIGVIEEAWQHGVARALIEELKRLGRKRGCVSMWVLTDEDNHPAMGLYRGTGGTWDGRSQVMFEYRLSRS
jgi:ribosomal protein S18 acetylase RimI-like enzyme